MADCEVEKPIERCTCIDFETYYDDEVSVQTLGNWQYVHHPRWHVLLVTLYAGPGQEWTGPAEKVPWERFRGSHWIAHNSGFEYAILERLVELNQAPQWILEESWSDTAALAAYVGSVRSLREAAAVLLEKHVSKDVRSRLKGVTRAQLEADPRFLAEVIAYAKRDAETTWELWHRYSSQWPASEQALSWWTQKQCAYGVAIDVERLRRDLTRLEEARWALAQRLPWVVDDEEKPGSLVAMAQACRTAGIPVPPLKSEDEEGYQRWVQQYGVKAPWVRALEGWRQVTRTLATLKTIQARLRPDGTIEIPLLYFGAHTGRWSGGGGRLNLQNLRKTPLWLDSENNVIDPPIDPVQQNQAYAVNIRALFVPRPGRKMIVADLAQIEPRVLYWVVGQQDMLQYIRQGMSVYEAFARICLGWRGGVLKQEDPELYHLAKTQVLGLGYGCGASKFYAIAQAAGLNLSPQQCEQIVSQYRARNPLIVQLWSRLAQASLLSVGSDLELALPSGRTLRYRNVRRETVLRGLSPEAVTVADVGIRRMQLHGGVLTENLIQAIARDIFAEVMQGIEAAGLGRILWHVHDELILEADSTVTAEEVARCVRTPEWGSGCPVELEAREVPHYCK